MRNPGTHLLPPLPYPYDALHPALSQQAVEWHHLHHHAALVQARNEAERTLVRLKGGTGVADVSRLLELKRQYSACASGMVLHECYWRTLHPSGKRQPGGDLAARLRRDFGSYELWVEDFIATALIPEIGWALLVHDPSDHRLRNVAVEKHDEGAVWGALVLLACDLWEHAYYPDYGPHRDEYIRAFLDLLDWEGIAEALYRSPYSRARPQTSGRGTHSLPDLPFSPDALQGFSTQTIRWHHEHFHASHVQARNRIEQELLSVDRASNHQSMVAFKRQLNLHAAGQQLHNLYWRGLGGDGSGPHGELRAALQQEFGSFDGWQRDFKLMARTAPSGWTILLWEQHANSLSNLVVQEHDIGALWHTIPLLACDLWEHAYYYDYGPERAAYLDAFLSNVNWRAVEAAFAARF